MRFVRLIAGLALAVGACLTFNPRNAFAVEARVSDVTNPLQFTSGGHVLGFTARQVVVATGNHALRVEFAGAREVVPVTGGAAAENGRAAPLGRVTYANLWEGITLAYDAPSGGLLRSTYTVAPGADPARIRLRYNAPVSVEPGGDLKIAYATGTMRESAPVAWQQIDGRRVPVSVSFGKMAEAEVGFQVGAYDRTRPLTIDPTLTWNTFLGGDSDDYGWAIAVDASGNTYVTGESYATWGSPVRAFSGGDCGVEVCTDAFVAKLDGSGALQWNTFLGGDSWDGGYGIAVDASGNAYVTGESSAAWGSPVRTFSGYNDAFVAKLDDSGALQWSTFLGGGSWDGGYGIAVDASGNAYVTGESYATWGSPVRAFSGGDCGGEVCTDAFVAKLDGSGTLQWSTFLGGGSWDGGYGIAVDASGNAYITGESDAMWGNPVRAFSGGGADAFVAKLNGSGVLQWNTFLGGNSSDNGYGIALDADGNPYVTGFSDATWGSPFGIFNGGKDAFVAKLDGSGVLQWNTFLGGSSSDWGSGIAVDASGNAYVTGDGFTTWGSPVRAFVGGNGYEDAFVAIISSAGWRNGEADLGSGWKWLDWFGYYSTTAEPWIYHQEHQWLYPYDDGVGGVFFWYDDMQEFVWTDPATYPYLYRFGGSPAWLWYQKDSANPRWFYNYAVGAWEQLP